jgi:hypothetical protein
MNLTTEGTEGKLIEKLCELNPLDFFTAEFAKIAEGLLLFFSACSALSAVNLRFVLTILFNRKGGKA